MKIFKGKLGKIKLSKELITTKDNKGWIYDPKVKTKKNNVHTIKQDKSIE